MSCGQSQPSDISLCHTGSPNTVILDVIFDLKR
jgi:hypothetical protein